MSREPLQSGPQRIELGQGMGEPTRRPRSRAALLMARNLRSPRTLLRKLIIGDAVVGSQAATPGRPGVRWRR